jgi:hypothetical protein
MCIHRALLLSLPMSYVRSMPNVAAVRRWLTAVLPGLVIGLGASAPAQAASWTPVAGVIRGAPVDAVTDGPNSLVAGVDRSRVIVTTVARGRVRASQVVGTGNTLRRVRVFVRPGGGAVVVWDEGRGVSAAYRPSRAARFGPERTISRHPGVATGAARSSAVAMTAAGRVLVAWWGGPAGGRLGIYASELVAAGVWSSPVEISAGVYPNVSLVDGPPIVALAAAAAPDGAVGVVWRQPLPRIAPLPRARIVAAWSTPEGLWTAPVALGEGEVTSFDLTASIGNGGELVSAWTEARSFRGDGVVDLTCLVAAIAPLGGISVKSDLSCRPLASPGRVRVATTQSGGTVAAWQVVPDYFAPGAPALRSSIEIQSRTPGSSVWSAPRLAVADARGYHDLECLAPTTGGRMLLGADLSQSLRPRDDGRLRMVLLDSAGVVLRRLSGPPTPGRPKYNDQRLVALPGGAALFWTLGGYPYRSRASLLTLGAT